MFPVKGNFEFHNPNGFFNVARKSVVKIEFESRIVGSTVKLTNRDGQVAEYLFSDAPKTVREFIKTQFTPVDTPNSRDSNSKRRKK